MDAAIKTRSDVSVKMHSADSIGSLATSNGRIDDLSEMDKVGQTRAILAVDKSIDSVICYSWLALYYSFSVCARSARTRFWTPTAMPGHYSFSHKLKPLQMDLLFGARQIRTA